ncbi:MAG: fimbria/pilus outer membrane usher protein [Alphaproteobacteria bacterium]|nr:fimbria/pilus outer membrane usher protein [Alphaproteobacteria bacterium]
MKKHLITSLLFCSCCSVVMKAESLGTESNLRYEDAEAEPSVSDLDLKYADSEELYRQVFGYVEQQEDMLFDADVLVDGEKSGSAPTFIGKICKIQAASLKYCLEEYLEPEDINIIDKYKDEDGFVEFSKLDILSLKTRLNQLTMQVEVSLPVEKKRIRNFSDRRGSQRERSNVDPANVSAVMNVRVSQSFERGKSRPSNKKNLIFTPYVNLFGICVEGEASYEQSTGNKGRFRRDRTTVVYDWAEPDVMFKLGDIISQSLNYQSPPHLWGFNINKDVEREKSEGFSSPIRITLLKTSTIEVYSNNHLIRTRTNVAPGTYILDDISYNSGTNDIKIKVIDESGRVEILDESFFYESSYVPKGKFTFNGSYGYPEINDSIKGRYDKKNPLLSLTFKYGLLSSVEVGLGLLRNKSGKTCSYEIRNKNTLGHFDFKFATSNYRENNSNLSGKVYYAQYSSPSINLFGKTNLNFSASIEKSDNFFRPYLAKKDENFKFNDILRPEENVRGKNTTIRYRASLSNILSFNTGFSYYQKKTFDKKSSRNISWDVSRGFSIDNNWLSNGNISANFNRSVEYDGKRRKSFSIYCSLSLKNHVNLSSGYSRDDDKSTSYISVSHSPENTGFSYDITAEKSSSSKKLKINTNYSNSIFKGNINHSRNNQGESSTLIGAESALYFADGRFAIARTDYSDGGFVLVTPKKDLAKHKIKFLNKDTESGFMGGGAVLKNSRISSTVSRIDLKDIPDNIALKLDTIVSQGQYKRGFIADIQGIKSVTARGILVDSQGKILEQVTGFAINKDNTDEPPVSFFTNSLGEFSLTELKPGNYKLTINVQNTEPLELKIKETPETEELDLGTVVCKDSIKKGKNDENT